MAPPGSVPAEPVPEQWRPILESDDAESRRLTALSWNREFLDLVPQFAQALRTELADVRVGQLKGEAVLVYAFEYFFSGERYLACSHSTPPSARPLRYLSSRATHASSGAVASEVS